MGVQAWIEGLTAKQKVEYLSFGSGSLILFIAILVYISGEAARTLGGALFVAGIVITFLPYALFTYFHDKKYREMEEEFPPFLRNLSEGIKSGMSLPQAFQQATKTEYGRLDPEIERAAHQLSWGVPFPEVMHRMADRIEGSDLIKRATFIVLQSYESGGNISETLDAIAANAARIKEAEAEKAAVLTQQVYIIYAIHFLFLGILLALFVLLDSFLLGDGSGFGPGANFCQTAIAQPICTMSQVFGIASPGPGGLGNTAYYKGLFLLMIVVGGIFNGLVAGEVVDGKVSGGVKHALLMAPTGFIIYLVAITILG